MRLDIPAGTAVRFEPGQTRTVTLVPYRGDRWSSASTRKSWASCDRGAAQRKRTRPRARRGRRGVSRIAATSYC